MAGPCCVMSFEAVAMLRELGFTTRRLEDGRPKAGRRCCPSTQGSSGADLWGRQAATVQGQPAAIDRFAVAED
jgi:hypothetical protein